MSNNLARCATGLVAALCVGPAFAQGTTSYLNFESPAHKPIACTTAAGRGYLLVCNGPDNAVEIYSTRTADSPTFVTRVAVGLEPVSVVTKPSPLANDVRRCYVANWLGDSITIFDLTPTGTATVVTTRRVGDEPTGIAFHPTDESLIVTFSAQSTWGWFNGNDLAPMQPGSDFLELVDVSGTRAVKDPRAVAFSPATAAAPNVAGQLCILNHRGGSDATAFDYDLWSTGSVSSSVSSQRATLPDLGTLGSTNFNMAFASNGDLYVVSQQARNKALANFVEDLGEPAMANLVTGSTGFVTSQLVRVRGIGSSTPVVDPALDLNSTTTYQGTQSSVAVTQPTDLAIKGDGSLGTRVFVTGFNSDSLGVATTAVAGFTMTRVDLGHPTNSSPAPIRAV